MNEELTFLYEAKAKDLRAHLKTWENDWARTHRGSKPGRQDIKDNPGIAEKYKEYSKDDEPRSKKRRPEPTPSETPLKRTRHAETPHRDRARDDELMNSPGISRKLFSPAKVTSLGPTPQKDGRVLGLFDLLVERELGTPSQKNKDAAKKPASRYNIHATPSKRTGSENVDGDAELARTPMSASKRHLVNATMTPMKNRGETRCGRTPTSVSKLQFDTPAFLKRNTLPTLNENDAFDMPAPLKLPRKPLVRGLSEIVASLRRVEEETLDDDLEALREAENEQDGGAPVKRPPQMPTEPDSQARRLPLGGFDDEGLYDSPEEDKSHRNGNPLAVYKKKAPKRTTRRVNIKPTWNKRPTDMAESSGSLEADEDSTLGARPDAAGPSGQVEGLLDDQDFQDVNPTRKPKAKAAKEGPIKKTVRKVNELAHANFQRLKLRNSGAKGGPGHNSRFRRRR
ncbi:DNA replication and checkpoint protein [Hirsutella rhossiliensis]|uniref:DNA replication regulator SLD2 n=1 Tax=Hirsutella rhossiliensis TaxID=111463 RepID=A0A9P8N137_9HYPO|nr:DNA replication and checkpoint protein [Hirsutella rhossiliensis]KAH0964657.1 DNA replication and checkpoint protein [Hirsutella rhossiliensis]